MTIASQLQDYADGLEDAYDAVNDMQGTIPQDRNMDNLDAAIRTIPQSQGATYTAGNGINIDANNEISIDTTVVAEVADLPSDFTGATSSVAGAHGLVPAPTTSDVDKYLKGDGTWGTVPSSEPTVLYINFDIIQASANTYTNKSLYKDAACTTPVAAGELMTMVKDGQVFVKATASLSSPQTCYVYYAITSYSFFSSTGSETSGTREFVLEGVGPGNLGQGENLKMWSFQMGGADTNTTGIFYREAYDPVTASATKVGGVKVGNTLSISNSVLDAKTMTGATSSVAGSAGLVPAPTTSDPDKFLKGDGTWGTPASSGSVMVYAQYNSGYYDLYKDSGHTTAFNIGDIYAEAVAGKPVVLYISGGHGYSAYVTANTLDTATRRTVPGGYNFEFVFHGAEERDGDEKTVWKLYSGLVVDGGINSVHLNKLNLQPQLFAGTGITIDNTDPNYPVISASASAATVFYYDDVTEDLYKDDLYTDQATFSDVTTAYNNGAVIIKDMTYETAYYSDGISVVAIDNIQSVFCLMQSGIAQYYVVYSYVPGGLPVWSHGVMELQNKLTAGTNISILGNTISATDTTYSDFTGATSSVAGAAGLVPAPAAGDEGKALHGDGTWKDTTAKLVEMSYGEANAWTKFIDAYNAGSIVYCRASSNANPASGSQTRKAFMAYVNNAASPTSVEFQYVRSVSSKTEAQPVDQVFVYTLTNASGGTWSVASRNMAPKIAAGTGINVSYSNGTYTISLA